MTEAAGHAVERSTSFGRFIRSTQLIIVLWFGVFLAYVINASDMAVQKVQEALGTLDTYNLVSLNCLNNPNPLGDYFCRLYETTRLASGGIIVWTMVSLGFLVVYAWVTDRYELRGQVWHPREALLFMYVLGLLAISFFPFIIRWASIGTLWFPYQVLSDGTVAVVAQPSVMTQDVFANLISISTDVSSLAVFAKYFFESMALVISIELMWLALTVRVRHVREFALVQGGTAAAVIALNVYELFGASQISILEGGLDATALAFVRYGIVALVVISAAIWAYGIVLGVRSRSWSGYAS
jgi:hypothetical protein